MKHSLSTALIVSLSLLLGCSNEPPTDPTQIKAEAGDSDAQFAWARQLVDRGAMAESEIWFKAASESGLTEAAYELARLLAIGAFGQERAEEGMERIAELAKSDHLPSLAFLGERLLKTYQTPEQREEAYHYYQRAANMGDPHARYQIARRTWMERARMLTSQELNQLKAELYEIGKSGEPLALGILGRVADFEGDVQQADNWFFEASKAGDPYSMYRTGIAYHRHAGDAAYGPLGFELLQKAEAAGVPEALGPLGKAHYLGNGTKTDESKGLDLVKIAALRGDEDAVKFWIRTAIYDRHWEFEEAVDRAVVKKLYALDEIADVYFRQKTAYVGYPFESLVGLRLKQLQEAAAGYQLGQADSFALPPLSKVLTRYGDDAELALEATREPTAARSYQMALNFLSPEKPYMDQQAALRWLQLAASQSHPDAGLKLYELYNDDSFEPQVTVNEVIVLLQQAAGLGDLEATMILAREYAQGAMVAPNADLAVRYSAIAYDGGVLEAKDIATDFLANRRGLDFENPTVSRFIDELADSGNLDLRFERAKHRLLAAVDHPRHRLEADAPSFLTALHQGRAIKGPLPKVVISKWLAEKITPEALNPAAKAAAADLVEAAKAGQAEAKLLTASWMISGIYLEQDPQTGVDWLEALAKEGDCAEASYYYAWILYKGYHRQTDIIEAAKLFHKAAEMGYALAAQWFPKDISDHTSPQQTIPQLAYLASEKEDDEAMVELAYRLRYNEYFERDYTEAQYLRWIAEAAKRDNIDALGTIGLAFFTGDGVKQDILKGMRYIERCADLGDPLSQYRMAYHLMSGAKIESDVPRGLRYLKLAADQDFRRATQLLQDIATAHPGRDFATLEAKDLAALVLSSVSDIDIFPITPYVVANGTLLPISGVSRNRPTFDENDRPSAAAKDAKTVFLAAAQFHQERIEIKSVRVDAPIAIQDNALIFTGLDPAISFDAESAQPLEDVFCLLLVRNPGEKTTYEWRSLGTLKPGQSKRVKFAMESAFTDLDDISIHFFADHAEIATNVRRQPNFFLNGSLQEFTRVRNEFLDTNTEAEKAPSLYKPLSSYFHTSIDFPDDAYVYMKINKHGFVSEVELPQVLDPAQTEQLLSALTSVTFLPRLQDGLPTACKIKVPLN